MIDTHCHLDLPVFDRDRAQILAECERTGITDLVIPAIQESTWQRLLDLCATSQCLHPALGLHPMFLHEHRPIHIERLAEHLSRTPVAAVGEIGLDFHDKNADRSAQTELLRSQLQLAARLNLPVILHVRKAHDQVLSLLRETKPPGGTCHAFNGSIQQAGKYIELGFKLGFGGMLTYDRSHKLHKLAGTLPLDALVLETDAPDMSPARHHGQRNSPAWLPEIAAALAELREQSLKEIYEQTTLNARECLRLS